jgi:hypothetical protein
VAALIPAPRVNLTRFHGVFAPNSRYRPGIVTQSSHRKFVEKQARPESEKRDAIAWASRLKRVFNIDISTCESCGGTVKVIACIEDPGVISKILRHLQAPANNQIVLPASQAPPTSLLLN